jgi:chemotaxis protein MotB
MPRRNAPPDPPGSAVASQIPRNPRRSEPHRGGAWKVAYADFVTALMALFIVLWMMNANERVKQSVRGYFLDPRGYTRQLGAGSANSGEGLRVDRSSARDIQDRIEQALRQMPDFENIRSHVVVSVTGEGLRIDLLETEQGMFFISGNPTPTTAGVRLLETLAAQLCRMPNSLVIEGHTDALPFRKSTPSSGYGNWDLAADRANAARRLLHAYGVRSDQVVEMRGFADRRLLFPGNPNDPRNRRVSLVVKFATPAS